MHPTLLFLPGTLCDARLWAAAVAAFEARWRCVVADYRHHESVASMAATALQCAAGPVIPIGLSMGGIIALEIWHQAPQRVAALALFDMDPGADTPQRRSKRDAQVLRATHGDFAAMVEGELVPTYFSPARAADEALRRTVVSMALDQGVGAFAAQATALAMRRDSWPLLDAIGVPVLVACGAEDVICRPEWHERMAAILPKGTFRPIRDAGHLCVLEQPEACMHALRDWIDMVCPEEHTPRIARQ